ncbi:hypothetical protein IDJ75_04925 [Mucilaginibacter rigui]|uniref:SIR2-like domain-containing protein n=1 Tax=Mucilaginibacter rigui TaxID=534635 RepID=A0ABR7X1Y7_9SPHI|nr:hypothetical protein [Mucilaginibacter rigui]MBD1384613.1 hypothetical protein [Mucilaginibacter rigui]
MPGLTIEQGINQVMGGRHIVILGAGASIAATRRNAELNGKVLPSMLNFIDVLGLQDIVADTPPELRHQNFETLYGNIYAHDPESALLGRIQERIQNYFGSMRLPNTPTIYDYLILSLRAKDHIATFNWDPFLYQAWCRNREFTKNLPYMSFLHGTVALGYSKEDKRSGPVGYQARRDGGVFEPVPLLYPIQQKNYNDGEFIIEAWDSLKAMLHKDSGSVRATIFGYGAPVSDVEAVDLLSEAWGTADERAMEQFEVIDIVAEDELRERWDRFIHTHHYDITDSYFGSSLALNPRRTCESYFSHYRAFTPDEAFRRNNPIPQNFTSLGELWAWHQPLLDAERREGENED